MLQRFADSCRHGIGNSAAAELQRTCDLQRHLLRI